MPVGVADAHDDRVWPLTERDHPEAGAVLECAGEHRRALHEVLPQVRLVLLELLEVLWLDMPLTLCGQARTPPHEWPIGRARESVDLRVVDRIDLQVGYLADGREEGPRRVRRHFGLAQRPKALQQLHRHRPGRLRIAHLHLHACEVRVGERAHVTVQLDPRRLLKRMLAMLKRRPGLASKLTEGGLHEALVPRRASRRRLFLLVVSNEEDGDPAK
jgi:hypothetical protein